MTLLTITKDDWIQFLNNREFNILVAKKDDYEAVEALEILKDNDMVQIYIIESYTEFEKYLSSTTLFVYYNKDAFLELKKVIQNFSFIYIANVIARNKVCNHCLILKENNLIKEYSEIFEYYRNNSVKVYTYLFPLLKDIDKLTDKEAVLNTDMRETINYNYVEKEPEFYLELFDKYNDINQIREVMKGVPIIEKNGRKVTSDYKSKYCNVINGERFTTDVPDEFSQTIYIMGKSQIYGYAVEDADTIASALQRYINTQTKSKVRVVNLGISAINDDDFLNILKSIDLRKNDILIYVYLKRRCSNSRCRKLNEFKDLSEAFNAIENRKTMFLDSIPHTNHLGNKVVAEYIFNDIKESIATDIATKTDRIDSLIDAKDYSNDIQLQKYLSYIREYRVENFESKKIGAIVMNCNPFTLGHRYLIETAASQVDMLYIFVVEEDKSFFPFKDRIELVKKGTSDLENVVVLPSGRFMISSLTFPEYFDKEKVNDVSVDTSLDMDIFGNCIAKELNISVRFAGEEPNDAITRQYNISMREKLPQYSIDFVEIKRKSVGDNVISATTVRKYLKEKDFGEIKKLVPTSTYEYLKNIKRNNM